MILRSEFLFVRRAALCRVRTRVRNHVTFFPPLFPRLTGKREKGGEGSEYIVFVLFSFRIDYRMIGLQFVQFT